MCKKQLWYPREGAELVKPKYLGTSEGGHCPVFVNTSGEGIFSGAGPEIWEVGCEGGGGVWEGRLQPLKEVRSSRMSIRLNLGLLEQAENQPVLLGITRVRLTNAGPWEGASEALCPRYFSPLWPPLTGVHTRSAGKEQKSLVFIAYRKV